MKIFSFSHPGKLSWPTTCFLFLFVTNFYSHAKDTIPDENHATHYVKNSDSYKIGKRLFHGVATTGTEGGACISCHNVVEIDSFNWNPSVYEIAILYEDKDTSALQKVLNSPAGGKLAEAHAGYQFSARQISSIDVYLKQVAKDGLQPEKPDITRAVIFAGLILLIILVLIDLIFTRVINFKPSHFTILLFAGAFATKMIVEEAIDLGRSEGFSPDQPIKFSHVVHAKENNIDCRYCHNSVEFSKSAGIPATNVCMNCHVLVREGSHSGKFEINKIYLSDELQKPIEWIRVHHVPDHVYFNHAQHVHVGKVECATCHGEVEEMHRIIQVSDLSMGWCVNCHRDAEVQFIDNEFYQKYEILHEKLKNGEMDMVMVEDIGGIDCMKCHY